MQVHPAAWALLAAALFGASTPLAKLWGGAVRPLSLAGLLYLGSGLGLALPLALRLGRAGDRSNATAALAIARADVPWLAGAIVDGSVLGPALLMTGPVRANAAAASLLLNVEGVFTALIAWRVFRMNADRRIVAGMVAIVIGGVLLS